MSSKNPIEAKQGTQNKPFGAPAMSWDAIDEASWDALPASPPTSARTAWSGKDGQPEEDEEEEEQRAETD